jgi:MoCo/4Fe-4S cofactor protein with predicted Tat translocation signal
MSKTVWRSLEERAEDPAFLQQLQHEFPQLLAAGTFSTNRRQFLKLMGAMLSMAGLAGCSPQAPPNEVIVPYVNQPEQIIPGKPLFYATAMPFGGYAKGVLVENHMGRPTKIEGNPQHPTSLGATDPFMQASVLALYDPDRAQVVSNQGQISTWEAFLAALTAKLDTLRGDGGAGLHILTETITSPTVGAQMAALREQFPQLHWHQYEPINLDNVQAGAQLAFGRIVNPLYHFDQAERVFALDADFLYALPGSLRYARQWIDGRRIWQTETMNRLYVVESTPTITGAKADHRLPLRASQIASVAAAVARAVGVDVPASEGDNALAGYENWIAALVDDLQASPATSLVVVGPEQPPFVHALGHAINGALGSVGRTVTYTEPVEVEPVLHVESLRTLVADMDAGRVDTLLIFDDNPVYTAPVDLDFAERLGKVNLAVHTSLYYDETSTLCHWHIPAAHYLEAWGDVRADDGVVTIIQPLIAPLFNSKTSSELLAALLGQPEQTAYAVVRGFWDEYYAGLTEPVQRSAEAFWRTALHDGVVADTARPAVEVTVQADFAANLPSPPATPAGSTLEIRFRPDPTIWDGRFANNAWLQELPKHLTTLTWDNAALISAATADRLGLTNEALVALQFADRTLEAAIWITPGQADDVITLSLGYGRTAAGQVGNQLGFNAYALRTSDALWFGEGVEVQAVGRQYPLSLTQTHWSLEGRELLRAATLEHYQENPAFARGEEVDQDQGVGAEHELTSPSLYPEYHYDGYAWGMAIDMTACIGCNACVIACDLENNIPTVGKEGVRRSREMHWLLVDRYYEGEVANPTTYFQPRLCMHCEKAPCEPVCPVEATLHDSEGLNQMVYNRCVGTRYCSNNCPYKVRRFNFFDYTGEEIPLLEMARNPDVTVRSRGVMEKCTYCVQRINQARIEAEKDNRPLQDGEVLTACQTACPTRAIVFGDINQPESQVAQMKAHPLNYGMLADLGTQPRTTYLAEVHNPNPTI